MANEDFNKLQGELSEDESLLFEIFIDPVAYDRSTGSLVGHATPFYKSISQVLKTLLPDMSQVRIQSAIKGLESHGLVGHLSSPDYEALRHDKGIRLLQNKLTEKGKAHAQRLASTSEYLL
ncbi:MAG: hypothetical protein HY913_07250 [Desulfomonile tiedjei]|nr:hypothetical protein [Desulfomonile tiedjei]